MKNHDGKEKRTLAVFVFIFLLLVMSIVIGGYVSYRNFERGFRHQAENQISAIAELKVNELVNWREERLNDAEFLYHNPAFSTLVERYFENPDDVDAQAQLLAWLDHYQAYNQYDRVQLLDVTGIERFSVPAAPDKVETQWVIDATANLRSGKITFLDFHRDTSAGHDIHLAILVPIFADKNNDSPLGVLALSINPQTYLYPYIQNWPTPSDTAETLLVRRDGENVLFLNELRFEKNAALNLRHPLTNTDIPAVNAVLGQTGIVEGTDYRGEPVLADVRAVPDSPWFLISKMDTAEVYAPLRARLWQTLLIIGMAIFVAGTGLALVWRQQRILFYRTQAETVEALRASEEKFRKAFVLSPDSININRLQDGMYVSINNSFTKITGYAADDVIGKTSLELNIWADPQDRNKLVDGLTKNGEVENLEMRFLMKNGGVRHGLMSASVLDLNGVPHIISITRDTTERKQAEDALRENEEKYRRLFDNAPLGIFQSTPDGKVISINPAFTQMLGYDSPEDAMKSIKNISTDIFADPNRRAEIIHLMAENPDLRTFENVYRRRDGSTFTGNLNAMPVRDADGRLLRMEGIVEDITERKGMEEALRTSEAFLDSIIEHSPYSMWISDSRGTLIRLNQACRDMLHITDDEVVGKYNVLQDSVVAEQGHLPLVKQVFEQGMTVKFLLEYDSAQLETPELGKHVSLVLDVTISPVLDADAHVTHAIIQHIDITERKQAEERLAQFFSVNLDLLCIADLEGNFIKVNNAWESILGYSAAELEQRKFLEFVHPEDMDSTLEAMSTLGKQEQVLNFVNRYRCMDGSYRFIEWRSQPSGNLIYAAARDITERKQAEEALRESEEKMSSIFRVAPTGIGVVRDRVLVEVNPRISEITGYTKEELIGQSARIFYPTQDEFEWVGREKYNQIAEEGSGVVETRWQKKDGSIVDVLLASTPIDLADLSKGVTFTALDITERKRAEEALRENEAIFSSFLEHSPVYVFFKDKDTRSLRLSKNYEQMLGMPLSDLLGKTMDDLFPSDLAKNMGADDLRVLNEGKLITVVEEFNGRVYETTKFPVLKDGNPYILAGFTLDVTERRQAEEALEKSEALYHDLVETSQDLIWQCNAEGEYTYLNPAWEQVFGYKIEEMLGKKFTDFQTPQMAARDQKEFFSLMQGNAIKGLETIHIGKLGNDIQLVFNAKFLTDENGKVIGTRGTAYDITARKQAEESLFESEERFRTHYDNATIGLYRTTPDGRILMLNPAGVQMLGFDSFDEIAKRNLEDAGFEAADSRREFREKIEREGVVIGLESKWTRKDGSGIFVRESAKAFRDGNGETLYYDGSFEDVSGRVQAEAALRESEKLYRKMNENSPIGMHFYNLKDDNQLIFAGANPAADKLLGMDHSQFVGKTIEEAFPPLMQTEVPQRYRDAAANGTLWSTEQIAYEDRRISGAFEVKAFQTTPGNMVAVFADITARRQAVEALQESEKMFRVAFDNAPTGMSLIGPDGFTYLAVNPLLCEMFGYAKEEFLGKTISLVTHPDDEERSNEWIIKKYNDEPCEPEIEKRYIHKDGHIVWGLVRAQWIKNEDGSHRMAIAHILDITKRKQAEEALRESEALYRQAIEVANAVPYRQSYHVNGKSVDYDFIGEGIREITGYGPEEFNEPLWDSLTQERFLLEDLAEYSFDEAIERVRSGVSPVWKCEHHIRARDGSMHWVFEAAVELRDQNGISHGSIGLFQDITARKQAEEEILQLNLLLEQRVIERTAQLENTNRELEAFSYSVSHDLRAPLRGIDGWSQALLEDYHDKIDEQGQLYIDRVRSETQRMGRLIDDMLQLSRLTRAEMVKERVDLSALAQTIVERLKQNEPQRQVDFNIQAGLTTKGDSHLLEAVLANLLGNAFKFTGKRADARIEFGQTESQGQRAFFVRDNGAGFDMAYSQKLFGAFQRMHKVSEFPGTGIGLATVQRVIHRHGGRVWAEAEVERGATFYFTLG